jgi:hypothetical protein
MPPTLLGEVVEDRPRKFVAPLPPRVHDLLELDEAHGPVHHRLSRSAGSVTPRPGMLAKGLDG